MTITRERVRGLAVEAINEWNGESHQLKFVESAILQAVRERDEQMGQWLKHHEWCAGGDDPTNGCACGLRAALEEFAK